MRRSVTEYARDIWLDLVCATERQVQHQEPAVAFVRGRDLLWFLVPIIGIIFFVEAPRARAQRSAK